MEAGDEPDGRDGRRNSRRRFLATLTAATSFAVAGCNAANLTSTATPSPEDATASDRRRTATDDGTAVEPATASPTATRTRAPTRTKSPTPTATPTEPPTASPTETPTATPTATDSREVRFDGPVDVEDGGLLGVRFSFAEPRPVSVEFEVLSGSAIDVYTARQSELDEFYDGDAFESVDALSFPDAESGTGQAEVPAGDWEVHLNNNERGPASPQGAVTVDLTVVFL